jgi:ketosteroid isomerase-like protein
MSQKDVEVVRRWLSLWDGVDAVAVMRDDAAWTRGRAEIEAFVEPACAFAWIALGQRVEATGLDGFRQAWLDFFEPWESVRNELDRIVPVSGKVVSLGRQHCRMAGTLREVELIGAGVHLVREGRVARAEFYANRAEALEAVGLRE